MTENMQVIASSRSRLGVGAAICLGAAGLLHLAMPTIPRNWMEELGALGDAGARWLGWLELGITVPVVALHNRWDWPSVVITLIGWLILGEALLMLMFSGMAASYLTLLGHAPVELYQVTGLALVGLAVLLGSRRAWQ